MDVVFEFLRAQQAWLYLFLGIIVLVLLRRVLIRVSEYRRAIYGLEREKALKGLTGVSVLFALGLLFMAGSVGTFRFTESTIEVIPTPTPVPTLSFLSMPEDREMTSELEVENSAAPADDILLSGCVELTSSITSPADASVLVGVVEITGSANIQNFAFYKYEYRPTAGDAIWRSVNASTEPVVDGSLGTWDTGLITSGDYLFRLVVTDTEGNAPYPCVIRVQIEETEGD